MHLTTNKAWLSTADLAEEFGVSQSTVRYWRAKGTGPAGVRVGRQVRYAASDVEEWIDRLPGGTRRPSPRGTPSQPVDNDGLDRRTGH